MGRAHFAAAFLGGDEDDAVGPTGTVDGGRCSILEYGHGFDVLGRDVADVAARHSVYDHQRLVAGLQGGCTAHLQRGVGVGVGGCRGHDVQTGHLTGKHFHGVVHSSLEEIFLVHLYDGG